VIALTWSVDYWDYLGWKDTFAKPEFTDRQRAYDRRFGLRDVYTPQIIVGGAAQASGDQTAAVESMVNEARRQKVPGPQIRLLSGGRVAVGAGARPMGGGEVWLVRYDTREQDVEVKDGDNRGKTVVGRNIVREFTRLGAWRGVPAIFKIPPPSGDGLTSLIIVQGARGGRILGLLKRRET
jgi:hypothetical protein